MAALWSGLDWVREMNPRVSSVPVSLECSLQVRKCNSLVLVPAQPWIDKGLDDLQNWDRFAPFQ